MFTVAIDDDKATNKAKRELEKEIEKYVKKVDAIRKKNPRITSGETVADYIKAMQAKK